MLVHLHVKNLALIEEAEVDFEEGLNILTGETGAGKSILIGSVNLALGQKMSREMIREGADYAYVELVFQVNPDTEEKLKKQLAFMKKYDVAFSCTAYEQIDENGKSLNKIIKTVPKADYNRVLLDCPVGNSTVMYNVEKMGKFEVPNIRKRNDDALWLQMLKKEKNIYGMRSVLMKYRIRQNSISSNKFKVIKYHWILYRDIEHLSIARSVFHIAYWCVIKLLKIK